jgi:hypothetical protein
MRFLLLTLVVAVLVGCTQNQADFVRIGDRTFRIESPPIPGGAEGPNRRLAVQLCPSGYRVLNSESHKGGPDRADFREFNTTTVWVVKCL